MSTTLDQPVTPLKSPSAAGEETGTQQTPANPSNKILKLHWDSHTESLLANWGDIAACYKWLHEECFRKYDSINYWFSLPIIILSTVTGTVSMSMQSLVPSDYVSLGQKVVGGVNIITGIITTIQNTFRFAQKSEAHQNSSVGWSKLERNIKVELKIDRKNRKEADSFLKVCRAEYDRLLEQSPVIPIDVISKFNKVFSKHKDIIKPDICDNLVHTEVTVPDPMMPSIQVEQPKSENINEVLSNIKEMLAESRIVPVNIKDVDIPHYSTHNPSFSSLASNVTNSWRRSSAPEMLHLHPRKSFLGDMPKKRVEPDVATVSVKDLMKKFQTPTPVLELTPIVKAKDDVINDIKKRSATKEDLSPVTEVEDVSSSVVEIIVDSPKPTTDDVFIPPNSIDETKPERSKKRREVTGSEDHGELKRAPSMDINDLL